MTRRIVLFAVSVSVVLAALPSAIAEAAENTGSPTDTAKSFGPYLVNPPSCPPGGLVYSFSFKYENGESLGPLTPTLDCTGTEADAFFTATSPLGQEQGVGVTQTPVTPGQPVFKIGMTASLSNASLTQPSHHTEIAMRLPPGMVRNSSSFVTCPVSQLEAQADCPKESKVGSGSFTAESLPIVPAIYAPMTAWNGADGALLLHFTPDIGPNYILEGHPAPDGTLIFSVPDILTVPGADPATITELYLSLGATGTGTPPPPPPPVPDLTAPKQAVSGGKKQKLGSLAISLTLNEAATVTVDGAVNVPGTSKRVKFKTLKQGVSANQPTKLKPKLSKKNAKRVRKALKKGKKLTAKFKIKAIDAAGNTSSSDFQIKLKR